MRKLVHMAVWSLLAALMPGVVAAQDNGGSSDPQEAVDPLGEPSMYAAGVFSNGGFASAEDTRRIVGAIQIEVACPEKRIDGDQYARGASVTIGNPLNVEDNPAVVNTLVRAALTRTFSECPMGIGTYGVAWHNVGFVNIYGPPDEGAQSIVLLSAQRFVGSAGSWGMVTDTLAQQRATAEREAQLRAHFGEPPIPAQIDGPTQSERIAAYEQKKARSLSFMKRVWLWAGLALATSIAWQIWSWRESLARGYFFLFHPHPAAPMVQQAVESAHTSSENAKALANALAELPPEGAILRQVRLEQAESLVKMLQAANLKRQREFERQAKRRTIEAYEKAAFHGAQEAIALAVVALERAKTAYQTAATLRGGQS